MYTSVEKKFLTAVYNDLNMPKAVGILWKFIRRYRKAKIKYPSAAHTLLLACDDILGLGLYDVTLALIPRTIQTLVDKREEARQNKFWLKADTLREELKKKGWEVQDTPKGPLVTRAHLKNSF